MMAFDKELRDKYYRHAAKNARHTVTLEKSHLTSLCDLLDAHEELIAKYEEALTWYANESNYNERLIDDSDDEYKLYSTDTPVRRDKGERARKALKKGDTQ